MLIDPVAYSRHRIRAQDARILSGIDLVAIPELDHDVLFRNGARGAARRRIRAGSRPVDDGNNLALTARPGCVFFASAGAVVKTKAVQNVAAAAQRITP